MCVYKKDVCEYHPATENLYSVNQFYGKGYTTFSITSSWRLLAPNSYAISYLLYLQSYYLPHKLH